MSGATSSRSGPGIVGAQTVAARRGRSSRAMRDPDHDVGRGLAHGHAEQLLDAGPRHLEAQVEAVQQRSRDAPQVAEARRLAAAAGAGLAAGAARAGVHGGHQLEARRELHRGPRPGHPHDAFLERLAEPVQDRGLELAELIQEQHPAVGQRDLARAHAGRAAADHGHERRRVVRRPQRWPADEPARERAGRPPSGSWWSPTPCPAPRAGSRPGRRWASIVLPAPGGPSRRRW